jgi:hypothetical protein
MRITSLFHSPLISIKGSGCRGRLRHQNDAAIINVLAVDYSHGPRCLERVGPPTSAIITAIVLAPDANHSWTLQVP